MSEKCKPSYRNLNTIKSYSDQKYATVQWCEQNCENDEYLRQEVEKLKYLSPPSVRQSYMIGQFVDFKNSWGCKANGDTQVTFDNGGLKNVEIDFNTPEGMEMVDTENTTAEIKTYTDDTTGQPTAYYTVPSHIETREIPAEYESFGMLETANSAWYVGYNKAKDYKLIAEWLNNPKRNDIPSVCRAQTFKAEATGTLTSVDLQLDFNGSTHRPCGSPLYVQIWKTYKDFKPVTKYDKEHHKMKYVYIKYDDAVKKDERYKKVENRYKLVEKKEKDKKGKEITKKYWEKDNKKGEYVRLRKDVRFPGHNKVKKYDDKGNPKSYFTDIYHPLAEATFSETSPGTQSIVFDKPLWVKEGKRYAIVLFSPLSDWLHCPRWEGWGRNCKRSKLYKHGHAFMSEDNGRTWKIYGKNGADKDQEGHILDYKQGRYTPSDFAFQCNVETKAASVETTQLYTTDEEFEVRLKPIHSNPIRQLSLTPTDIGSETTAQENVGGYVAYEVSTDGNVWYDVNAPNYTIVFEKPYPEMVLVRAKIKSNDATAVNQPKIEAVNVHLLTEPATTMYARTAFNVARTEHMLAANVWGKLYAPFECDPTVECTAEIIQSSEIIDHFKIIELDELLNLMQLKEMNTTDLEEKTGTELATYLTDHYDIIENLRANNIYIKPFVDGNTMYLLSFPVKDINDERDGALILTKSEDAESFSDYRARGIDTFSNQVAYPIIRAELESENKLADPVNADETTTGETTTETPQKDDVKPVNTLAEWIDYTFDYDTNELIFKKTTMEEDLPSGDFNVTYNPIFIDGLTNEELGTHVDEDTGLREDGLVLDYFKETILVTNEHVENRRVGLRVKPLHPLRQIYLYKVDAEEGDEPINVREFSDYYFDLDTNEVVFEVKSTDGVSTLLTEGDTLEIVYTPALEDSRVAIGYYAKRVNTDMQCRLQNCYFEYKC